MLKNALIIADHNRYICDALGFVRIPEKIELRVYKKTSKVILLLQKVFHYKRLSLLH